MKGRLLLLVVAFQAAAARGGECTRPCGGDTACHRAVLECFLRSDRPGCAVEYFKPLVRKHPNLPELALYLARAYLAENNTVWARRTLQLALRKNPQSCELRAWLAWLLLQDGQLDGASEILDRPGCPGTAPERSRWLLLRTLLADARKNTEQAAAFARQLASAKSIYRGDDRLLGGLRRKYLPGWIVPFSMHLETGVGYTSNGRAGSPSDPDSRGGATALGRTDVFARLVWPFDGMVRPALEAGLKGHGLAAGEEREFSYLELSARPAVVLGRFPRVLIGYHADYLVLARDTEAERRFYEGHRAEVEIELGRYTLFGGFGRRIFAERGRTRFELDGGAGGVFEISPGFSLLAAASARWYRARGDPYDQVGATAVAAGRMRLGRGVFGRLLLSIGVDDYYDSGGSLGLAAYGSEDERIDVLIRTGAEVWSPPWHGIRAALGYEFSWRDSTIDQSNSLQVYDYTEHRLLAKVRWEFEWDFTAPELIEPPAGVGLGGGGAEEAALPTERIQDLLRQDEAARRGSSCVQ